MRFFGFSLVILAIIGTSVSADESERSVIFDTLLSERVSEVSTALKSKDPVRIEKSRYLMRRALDRCRIVYGPHQAELLENAADSALKVVEKAETNQIKEPDPVRNKNGSPSNPRDRFPLTYSSTSKSDEE
jgi:hypothetical protein